MNQQNIFINNFIILQYIANKKTENSNLIERLEN